jgi:hypothetical protein
VAGRTYRLAAIESYQGGDLQRHDDRGCFRKHVGVELSGHVELMALALVCTMAAAVLFQPVLMGRPRQVNEPSEQPNLRDAAE